MIGYDACFGSGVFVGVSDICSALQKPLLV